eukprot:361700-Chlamydomonas_euryale.AAC.3
MDGWMDGLMDGWMDGWMDDGQMDEWMHAWIPVETRYQAVRHAYDLVKACERKRAAWQMGGQTAIGRS